jgi:hypothetical protein
MTRFVFQSLHQSQNIGDRAASPARWLDFGPNTTRQSFGEAVPACDIAIFGGGQVYGKACKAALYDARKARHRVTWGVGMQSVDLHDLRHIAFSAQISLMGCRDANVPETIYVPCASCLCSRFDAAPAPENAVVIYSHGHKSGGINWPKGIALMSNIGGTLAQKLAFLASGETVVTNSFHGTYWAMLMGRKVLALPFSTKFNGFAQMPALADPNDWTAALPRAYALPGYLEHCRSANHAFYERVINLR